MTTTQPTAEQLRMARECAVSAVSTKLPGLMGNDFKGNIPKLRARIAKMRCAEGDHFVEVQSALLAIQATEARMAAAVEAERERCARLADDHSFALDIDEWMKMTKKEISAYACRSVAAAIRSQSNG